MRSGFSPHRAIERAFAANEVLGVPELRFAWPASRHVGESADLRRISGGPMAGIQSRVASDLNDKWGGARSCTSYGKCVQACPKGALEEKDRSMHEMEKQSKAIASLARRRAGRSRTSRYISRRKRV